MPRQKVGSTKKKISVIVQSLGNTLVPVRPTTQPVAASVSNHKASRAVCRDRGCNTMQALPSRPSAAFAFLCCPTSLDPRTGIARLHVLVDRTLPERLLLVAVHGHTLRAAAQLAVRGGADRSAAAVALCAALLQRQQLLGTEALVVDLGCRLDKILEVCPEQKVPQVDELAVIFVLDVDHAPSVLAATDLLAVDNDRLLGTDDGEGDEALM